jgi:hypothetical protein
MATTTSTPASQAAALLSATDQPSTGAERAEQAREILLTLVSTARAIEQVRDTKAGRERAALTRELSKAQAACEEYGPALLALAEQYATPSGRKRPEATGVATEGEQVCASGKACVQAPGVPLPLTKFPTAGHHTNGGVRREPVCRECRNARREAAKAARAGQAAKAGTAEQGTSSVPEHGHTMVAAMIGESTPIES